jgi:predicted transcriptional regulator
MLTKNRDRHAIVKTILSAVAASNTSKLVTRTYLMYMCLLSNDQCKMYLNGMVKSGLLKLEDRQYDITEKGKKLLVTLLELEKLVD